MKKIILTASLLISALSPVIAAEVNVYSARKEELIKPLLDEFEKAQNVKVNLITGKADALISRVASEGQFSPADVLLTTDVGRLQRAKEMSLLVATDSRVLEERIAANFRDEEGFWFALTKRARPIMYHPERVNPDELGSILDLTDSKWKGRICIRSSNNIYNQSMIASMIAKFGEQRVQQWANDFVKNFARKPKGGDRDQIKAVVAGQCDIAIANTYYLAGMLADTDSENQKIAEQLKVFWPDQQGSGAHINISGAAMLKHAPNKANALRLMEFLASESSQKWYADNNHEYPVVQGITMSALLAGFGEFKAEDVQLQQVGELNAAAIKLMDRAGWQ
ncbi:Fe(3+) ABC transporter substrate-binding protein [Planctobacterium marinum]|uniref:Iron deficiency-induced protein A n=1 Tax=Planctobacterium marinum TaxID=1631968 RepID=A0AA48HK64_9ALTE|nr:iron deficiency-induced protein A [Planctobacterium marinum]